MMDAFLASKSASQDWVDRDDLKAAGYRKLYELRFLKAAAARLVLQPDGAQQQSTGFAAPQSSSSSVCSSPSSSVGPLLRSISNIEHVMPAQRLSRANSMTDRSNWPLNGLPSLPRLGRSNSLGSRALAACLPPTGPQVLSQPSSMRMAPSAAPAGPDTDAVNSKWHRGPRHSEPVGLGHDERVELLLAEVEALLAERQQLSSRLCVVQKDNDQLAELVGRLARTVQEQDIQLQQLQMQQQHNPHHQRSSSFNSPSSPSLTLPHIHAVSYAGAPGPMQTGPASLQQHHQHMHHPHQHMQQQHMHIQQQQHLQQRQRVDEWLGRRQETWQEWQERIPLEHMHSGSSSTLTVSLDQA